MPISGENGTQRVNNAAAALDSVAAIVRRLAYLLLRFPTHEALSTIVEGAEHGRVYRTPHAFAKAREALLSKKAGDHRRSPTGWPTCC